MGRVRQAAMHIHKATSIYQAPFCHHAWRFIFPPNY